MKPTLLLLRVHICTAFIALASLCCCFAADSGKSPPPVQIHAPIKEMDLGTLTLTPEAEKRLGIETMVLERRKLPRTRLFSAEVILPVAVSRGDSTQLSPSYPMLPALSLAEGVRIAQLQIDADGQIEQAKVQLDASKAALARAEQMLRDKAGTVRTLDEARAQVGLAQTGLNTAQSRRDLLGPSLLGVSNPVRAWLRVPIYVGDLDRLDAEADAVITSLAGDNASTRVRAKHVPTPSSATASGSTVDLFYEFENLGAALRLGQRVGIRLPLREDEESLVVRASALVHDLHGGAWVYENSSPHTYLRRRVQVRHILGDSVALIGSVKPGAAVVTTGVAELFGTEFGAGK